MQKTYPSVIAGLTFNLTIGFILSCAFDAIAQSIAMETDSTAKTSNSKK
jgi:hypothetical protein